MNATKHDPTTHQQVSGEDDRGTRLIENRVISEYSKISMHFTLR